MKKSIIIILLIFLILLFILRRVVKKREYFSNSINFHTKETIDYKNIKKYLNNLSLIQLQHKTNNYNSNSREDLVNLYLSRIGKFTEQEKLILNKLISNITMSTNWNFVKFKDIEFNFPFTLDKYIFLPDGIVNNTLTDLLKHEQTHVLQRMNQKKYDKKYKKLYGKYIYQVSNDKIDFSAIEKIRVINPDEDNTTWIIMDKGKEYIVPYIIINRGVSTNKAYEIINNKVLNRWIPVTSLDYYKSLDYDHIILTHPNETYIDKII